MSVIVYSTPTCSFCHQLKEYLTENKIEFEDIDVSSDNDKAQEMIHKSGQMGVPVLDVDGEIVIGFDKKKINEILKIS